MDLKWVESNYHHRGDECCAGTSKGLNWKQMVISREVVFSMFRRFPAFLSLMLLCTMVSSQAWASKTAHRLLVDSALAQHLADFAELQHEQITWPLVQGNQLDPRMGAALDLLLQRNYSAKTASARLEQALDRNVSPTDLRQVVEWYDSPAGRLITKVERHALKDEVEGVDPSLLARLQNQYRGSPRETLFGGYDQALQTSQRLVNTSQQAQIHLVDAIEALHNEVGQAGLDQLRQGIRQRRFIDRGILEQRLYLQYLYTYRSISDQQLRRYIDFLQTAPVRHCSVVVNQILEAAALAPVQDLVQQLQVLKQQPED